MIHPHFILCLLAHLSLWVMLRCQRSGASAQSRCSELQSAPVKDFTLAWSTLSNTENVWKECMMEVWLLKRVCQREISSCCCFFLKKKLNSILPKCCLKSFINAQSFLPVCGHGNAYVVNIWLVRCTWWFWKHCKPFRAYCRPAMHTQAHNVPSSLSREPFSDFNLSFFFSGLLFLLSFPFSFTPFCFLFSPFWFFSAGRQKGFSCFIQFNLIHLESVTEHVGASDSKVEFK